MFLKYSFYNIFRHWLMSLRCRTLGHHLAVIKPSLIISHQAAKGKNNTHQLRLCSRQEQIMSSYSKRLDRREKWIANKRESKYHIENDVFWKEYSCYQTWSCIQTIESAIPKFECHCNHNIPGRPSTTVFHRNHLHHCKHCYKELY